MPRAAELRVLRGELLMTRGRYGEAAKDFEATLAAGAADGLVERALFGRASCRSHLGDVQGARADLTRYLERFPASSRAAEVRATLAR
jgi:outer membrane protein assembly factor BamD (BamD/ComL family)